MMKKITAALTALILLLGSLPALAAAQYGAWTIELTDVAVEAAGERVALTPSLTVLVGFTEDHREAWLTIDAMKDGRSLGGFRAEEDGKRSRYAYSEGESCGVMDGAAFHKTLMRQYLGMASDAVPDKLPEAVDMLDAFLNMPKGVEYLFSQLGSAKKLGKTKLAVSFELSGVRIEGTVSWRWDRRAKKPFDLSGRREADYDKARGVTGTEGFPQAWEALQESLAQDESMEEMLILMMLLFE